MRLLLVALILLTAADPASASEQTRLDDARAKWAAEGYESYTFEVNRGCFCPREYTRRYTMYVRDGEPYEPVKYVRQLASVPKLFDIVQDAIDGEGTYEVEYGPTGAPTRISLDPIPEAVDDESAITATAPRKGAVLHVPDVTIRDRSAGTELTAARKRWKSDGPTDYRYKVQYSCFCADTDPFSVTVRDGKAVGDGPSVLDLFDGIRAAIRNGSADLRVRYAKSGRPVNTYVDGRELIADDEIATTTRNLKRL